MSGPVPCRERVVLAALSVLQSVIELPCERNRKVSLQAPVDGQGGDLPRSIIYEGNEIPSDHFSGQDAFDLTLLVQVALNKSGADGASESNLMRAKLQRAFLADRTLDGVAQNLEIVEPGDWIGVGIEMAGGESSSDDFEGFILSLTVTYATVEGDPFTFA